MNRRSIVQAVAAVFVASSFALAQDAPTTADLKAQIDDLQKKVNQIEAREAAAPQTQATAGAVQADAATQSTLLPTEPLFGGYDKGFKFKTPDGKFSIQPGAYIQFRNVTNYRADNVNDLENGFEVRRMRFRLEGNAFTPNLRYFFQTDAPRNGSPTGGIILLDAFVQYNFEGGPWGVKLGQFRNSWAHEADISDTKQLAVERGLLDAVLGGTVTDREQAVALVYGGKDEPIQGEFAITDGDNSKNTDFRDDDPASTTSNRVNGDFGASGRLSYKFFGDWADYADFSAKGDKQDLLVAGAGVDFSENGDANVTRVTADAQYENTYGLSAYLVGHYNYTSGNDAEANDYGVQGQVGYLLNPAVEVFGRYAYLNLDNGFQGEDSFHEITGGVNYFFGKDGDGSFGHAVKFTLDLNYLPNGSPGNLTGEDYLASTDAEFVLRAQFQLAL